MRADRLRAIALKEWRGLPETSFVTETAKPVSEALAKVMKQLGLKDRLTEEQVLEAWSELVGPFISKHAAPHKLSLGVLHVRVLQSTVHYELDRVWKPQILAKFKAKFGPRTVREIRFRLG
jgi:predicted nucleic acid-binding Zn ribbon protein